MSRATPGAALLGGDQHVADFVTRTRMTIAADLLTGTERGLDDIAGAVGYRSASAFGKAFRAATGETPSALRRTARAR
ncbi:AraC family transcriptional regulator, activator of mtrCDE [Paractinoplanes atraurantiacus]|uniref:AraC family transcriptional regulator, activator of mtrCDE n=2 Tax=Paractinoplanes atraurantiacus TaxID=1036182 RepID=A0A285GKZ9_9ACTN|nr:helix-turn-helix domain-containing protein [Actinoplanes atraurantiacus]SNY24247.1 AraC family transcriptional regulator, activator of mtrCDE [Actinoplanes atraurantiacus]